MTGQRYTEAEWKAEGGRLFGNDTLGWRFECPSCGHVAAVADWDAAGAPRSAVAFSCVGRWTDSKATIRQRGKGPCNYTGGGLLQLNPVIVVTDEGESNVFAFAPAAEHNEGGAA